MNDEIKLKKWNLSFINSRFNSLVSFLVNLVSLFNLQQYWRTCQYFARWIFSFNSLKGWEYSSSWNHRYNTFPILFHSALGQNMCYNSEIIDLKKIFADKVRKTVFKIWTQFVPHLLTFQYKQLLDLGRHRCLGCESCTYRLMCLTYQYYNDHGRAVSQPFVEQIIFQAIKECISERRIILSRRHTQFVSHF